MKSFKLLLSVIALAALAATPSLRAQDASSSTSSSSQSQQSGKQHRQMDPAKMEAGFKAQIAKLTLTSAQQATINAAFADWDKQVAAFQAAAEGKKKPIIDAIKADREKIMNALTDDQKAQLHKGHGKKGQGSTGGN